MIAVAVRTCFERRHSILRRSFEGWRALSLVAYLRAEEAGPDIDRPDGAPPGSWIEVRRCDCGAQLGVVFHPNAQGLEALRHCGLSLLQLADLVAHGSREAGIVLQEMQERRLRAVRG